MVENDNFWKFLQNEKIVYYKTLVTVYHHYF